MTSAAAPRVNLAPASCLDAFELIHGHLESREHHHPWAAPFTDQAGFDVWFGRILTGPHLALVARSLEAGRWSASSI